MLVELVVENYAVIDRVRVRFHSGLNLLTGETGSGKSLIVDALDLLFGGRASADLVRTGAGRARVSGIFEAPESEAGRRLLETAGVEAEDGELLLEREVLAGGKSRAFAGSRPVTAALLRQLAPHLGDIHGQHEQQLLFQSHAQLEMLDAYAVAGPLLAQTAEAYAAWSKTAQELEELERSEQERLQRADLWSFQLKEIDGAAVQPGEDRQLDDERRLLLNVTRLQEHAAAAFDALYDSSGSALAQMRQAGRHLEDLCRIDASLEPLLNGLRTAEIAVEECSAAVRDYLGKLEADPARLEDVEARLALLDKLKRKYGPTLDDALRFAEEVRRGLEAAETAEQRRLELLRQREVHAQNYTRVAASLSALRRDGARRLEREAEKELAKLAMKGTGFCVRLEASNWSPLGSDAAAFLVSPNPGEEPRALEKVASGGELSRIALALKTCIAAATGSAVKGERVRRTLVFDEVDAGIGGAAAETVGRRLKQLAGAQQVLCVTHLPQIAGFADHHYRVEKRESRGRTSVAVEELTAEGRAQEIGRMLSGQKLTPEALRHAEQLIRMASE